MSQTFSNFTKCYKPMSKTLRFTLIPQGKTQEQIDRTGILNQDISRAQNYIAVKEVLDNVHKQFIEDCLSKIQFDWQPLFNAYEDYRLTKEEIELDTEREKYIKALSKYLLERAKEVELEPAKIIKNILKQKIKVSETEFKAIEQFDKFATYFSGYKENRENIYGEKQNSVAYRVVVDNFSKFYSNCRKYQTLSDEFKQKLKIETEKLLNGISLDELFSVTFFNKVITQSGIDLYNTYLGGVSIDETKKVQGINELCNLEYQNKKLEKKINFDLLYKQILSDRKTLSFVGETYQSDKELLCDLDLYLLEIYAFLEQNNTALLQAFLSNQIDYNNIYIDQKQITALSQLVFEDWSILGMRLGEKHKKYTLQSIQNVCVEDSVLKKVYKRYQDNYNDFISSYNQVKPVLSQEKISSYDEIKLCLDCIVNLEKTLKIFSASADDERDGVFYTAFDVVYNKLRENIPVYNRVRNYATKKEYAEEKYKINFDISTLGQGWAKSKEETNKGIILCKENKFYLGIYNTTPKMFVCELEKKPIGEYFKKMVYRQISVPSRDLPGIFIGKKKNWQCPEDIWKPYLEGKHIKGKYFDLAYCHKLIDYFKFRLNNDERYKQFGFKFSETEKYEDISQFYKEISQQAYKVSFSYVTKQNIDQLVEEGKLFLFQIYSKDFSEKSTGNSNLHTLYWKQLFSDENLKNPVFQLNGGAELFYRRASIENPFVHKKGTILVRKTRLDNSLVDQDLYQEAIIDATTMNIDELKHKYPDLIFRFAPHDIIKNKRFTKDQYKFHCPIAFNYDAPDDDNQKRFNERVARAVKTDSTVNVIGIDRGERNLLYVSVIDRNGNIIEQKSLNVVNGTNYHDKLVSVANRRDEQRKNWKTIENIKELKKGYLSVVINEICKLMIKHNAIIVMENLNYGFKNSRVHVEQQAYQNFEIALLQKLNYLAFKDRQPCEAGGVANAYQLSAKYQSFDKVGTQSGFVFYVPASFTSKIDPTTGFVNLFTSKHIKYENVSKAQSFFAKFENISYDSQLGFVFEFDYKNFGIEEGGTAKWKVCTGNALRTIYVPNHQTGGGSYEQINVTEQLETLFSQFGAQLNGELKEFISKQTSKQFYEKLLWLFNVTMRLRYSDKNSDYILSPIMKNGEFFDSRKEKENLPCDGDANGAYHIALKGLRLITKQISEDGTINRDKKGESNKNWFSYAEQMAKLK